MLIGSHGSRRFSLVLNVSQWFLLVIIGSQCFSSAYRMFSVVHYGSHGFSVDLVGSQWFS